MFQQTLSFRDPQDIWAISVAVFSVLFISLKCSDPLLPSDIFGMLMNMVKPEGFHPQIVDLIYKLILYGLKSIDFTKISYFSLVFSAQMLVLEYYSEFECLGPMLSFFLYQFIVYYLVHILKLDFDLLFIHSLSKSPT